MGHPVGDRVLAATAARLGAWARPRVVGRLGGDEFTIVAPHADSPYRAASCPARSDPHARRPGGRAHRRCRRFGRCVPSPRPPRHPRPIRHTTGGRHGAVRRQAPGADTALYGGKHSGTVRLATPAHASVPSVNGGRAGRPGTRTGGSEQHDHGPASPGRRPAPQHLRPRAVVDVAGVPATPASKSSVSIRHPTRG
ncbi:diguanylate cyclase domain-containing protein [Streptomyces sp. NPDC060011]|uniref:diguanylate cyclase domain-containing protein n=1 Tax=Streptomyces sp. NPDC060011 TaxID=3347037 RepID=UPI0036853246